MSAWSFLAGKAARALAIVKNRFRRGGAGHLRLGAFGEDLAVSELVLGGYRVLERNTRIYGREVDVIAEEAGALVFIEVKTRSDHSFGKPLEAVDSRRRARLRKAAELYVLKNHVKNVSIRFDVVTVDFTGGGSPEIEIVKNAF